MTARQALPAAIPGPSSPAAPATHNDRVVTTELQASRGMHREDRGSGGGQRGRAEAPVCVDVPSEEQPDWQREPEVQRPRAPGSGEVLADGLPGWCVSETPARGGTWAEARSQGLEGLTEFGLYQEGTGEPPRKASKQRSASQPEALSGPTQGLREAEPETGSLFFGKLAHGRGFWNPSATTSLLGDLGQMTYLSVLLFPYL